MFSEDVEVADVSGSVAQLGVFGPLPLTSSSRVLGSHGIGADAADLDALAVPRRTAPGRGSGAPVTVVRRDDLGGLGFDLLVGAQHSDRARAGACDAGAVDVDADVAEICRIESGRPVFGKDMTEDTIPLEAGIEDRAISLTKGCYVGQEIIIRVLHRGHGRVARRLVGLTLDPAPRRRPAARRSAAAIARLGRSRARCGRRRWGGRSRWATCTGISWSRGPR